MSKAYFDSSVLMSVLLAEPKAAVAERIWEDSEDRVSSVLLEAECWIGVRRHAFRAAGISPGWMEDELEFLAKSLGGVIAKEVDADILGILRREKMLADCRTLDAIHLATALYFREKSGEDIRFVTFDQRLRETAARLKFEVLPT